jgi:DNA-directed RNA polymerase omega subunit
MKMYRKIPARFEGRFGLVNVAATRARQLQEGAKPKIKVNSSSNPVQVAIRECLEDRVVWDYLVEDTRLPEETLSQPELKRAV